MEYLTLTTIVLASIIGFMFGAIWYSPFLFVNAWLKGQGLTKSDLPKRSKLYMLQINLYSLIAHGSIASVLAVMFDLLQITSIKVAVSLGVLFAFGFVVTTSFIEMVYSLKENHFSMKPQLKFLVNSGYYICVMGIMSAIIFLLA